MKNYNLEKKIRILFAGETYMLNQTFTRGVDQIILQHYGNTGKTFIDMLREQGFDVDHCPSHEVPAKFPFTLEQLQEYDVVIISDVGSGTFYAHPDITFQQRFPNRLVSLRDFVREGGGLLMCGGYLSFSGIQNKARFGMTPLAEVLPVKMLNYDDRIERPEGVYPKICLPEHPVMKGINMDEWPDFRGYNKTLLKQEVEEIATFDGDPFMVCMEYGSGRSFAFTSDCDPNWCTKEFLAWAGCETLFGNIIRWLARE